MKNFILSLETEFKQHANTENAIGQKAYMKNRFEFFGITSPTRKEIQKPFLQKEYLPAKIDMEQIVKTLWLKPQREFQYFAMEFIFKYKKQFEKKDIELFEFMVLNKSWWDSIDFIAPKLIGEHFIQYPELRDLYIEKWLKSENVWLQRSSILFQLNYKEDTDSEFLSYVIKTLLGSKEFFINKSIGWILRQYGKVNPNWVIEFVNKTELSNLSRKEALRIIQT